jgi:hypothetical protein
MPTKKYPHRIHTHLDTHLGTLIFTGTGTRTYTHTHAHNTHSNSSSNIVIKRRRSGSARCVRFLKMKARRMLDPFLTAHAMVVGAARRRR